MATYLHRCVLLSESRFMVRSPWLMVKLADQVKVDSRLCARNTQMCATACHFVCHLKSLILLMCAMCATKKVKFKILKLYFFESTFCFLMP